MRMCALSTSDNPYDPFDNFDEWDNFDRTMGYRSCEYLARLAYTSDQLGDDDYREAVEEAIDAIVDLNPNGKFIKVVKETKDKEEPKES